ncbi:hypothetical protein [Streptomyces spectabilis]|uniref:Uncharacterized protein n=1 Tax=Streptomyces spectabilis TaxID=68270 RepID=A0A5P2XJD6_STRST|nr:hypothetical protein [Streptomyces spectabilis]MBB5101926.1 hypothetical protein [Streptomyces spectabilis]MCI3906978.1 hypothetical protein [Streptomyces spectabilis]QEV63764.1 hypothetical protein CP982_37875 [Streptomyces spectabilis]GGV35127.1 hypothetical protein GCM10010245_56350 [Streptomyces spectabilis]
MAEEPVPARLGVEMRDATFPDGTKGVITVKAGLPQDEVDAVAARIWAETPARADAGHGPT